MGAAPGAAAFAPGSRTPAGFTKWGRIMPIVTIQVTREGNHPGTSSVSADEKAALIKGASELLLNVLNKPLEATYVIIEEVDTENWGWGGLPALEYRRQRARQHRG
jgi:4-oxalocrotonate tautomerase